jgi:hypothetical protein
VTETAGADDELQRARRALQLLLGCDEAFTGAASQEELLGGVCRRLVELGGFPLAVAGWAEGPDPSAIRPIAHHERRPEDLDSLRRAWAVSGAEGLATRALRTGQPVVANDLVADPRISAPREQLARLGHAAAVAIPIAPADERACVLFVVSALRDDFDETTIRALRRIAADLAHGIIALRTRALLTGVVDHAPVPFHVVRRDGRFALVNRAWEETTGRSRDEVLGRRVEEVFPAESARLILDGHAHVLASGRPSRDDAPVSLREELRVFDSVRFPMRDAEGKVDAIGGFSIDVTDRKASEDALRASREELRALAVRLQTAREEEKTRISRDLHDELGQLLAALKLDLRRIERRLEELDGAPVAAALDRAVAATALLDRIQESVQRIASELRPRSMDRLGIGAALQDKAGRFAQRTGLRCEVLISGNTRRVPADAATALFRIAQEALTNVVRHAGASRIGVALTVEPECVTLKVEDDGRGLTEPAAAAAAAGAHGGLGLLGMRERALALGGEVRVTGAIPRGTTVTARLPLGGPARGDA